MSFQSSILIEILLITEYSIQLHVWLRFLQNQKMFKTTRIILLINTRLLEPNLKKGVLSPSGKIRLRTWIFGDNTQWKLFPYTEISIFPNST